MSSSPSIPQQQRHESVEKGDEPVSDRLRKHGERRRTEDETMPDRSLKHEDRRHPEEESISERYKHAERIQNDEPMSDSSHKHQHGNNQKLNEDFTVENLHLEGSSDTSTESEHTPPGGFIEEKRSGISIFRKQSHSRQPEERERAMEGRWAQFMAERHHMIQVIENQSSHVALLQKQLRQAEGRIRENEQILDEKREELRAALVFLNKADGVSEADIIQKLDALNDDIFQAAHVITNMVEENIGSTKHLPSSKITKQMKSNLLHCIGRDLFDLIRQLSTRKFNPDSTSVALRACLVACSSRIISSWCGTDWEKSGMLQRIYAKIRETEEQAVAGRWRALTRTNAYHSVTKAEQEKSAGEFFHQIFTDIMAAFGWNFQDHPDILNSFYGELPAVARAAVALGTAVGKDVTSGDVEPFLFDPGTAFQEGWMEDEDADEEEDAKRKNKKPRGVFCTTGLGLARAVMSTDPASGGKKAPAAKVLMKAKVVLSG